MNVKARVIKRIREELLKNGNILEEYSRPPEPFYPKGSYFIHFQSKNGNYMVGDINKIQTYKSVLKSYTENEQNKK